MTDEVLKRIDALAAKLNVTAAELWKVLVKQARIEGIEWICWSAFWMIVSISMLKLTFRLDEYCKKPGNADWDGVQTVPAVIGVITFLSSLGCLAGTPGQFLNPEYWALKQIMDKLK